MPDLVWHTRPVLRALLSCLTHLILTVVNDARFQSTIDFNSSRFRLNIDMIQEFLLQGNSPKLNRTFISREEHFLNPLNIFLIITYKTQCRAI